VILHLYVFGLGSVVLAEARTSLEYGLIMVLMVLLASWTVP
jgi:hypothetical protein